MLVKIDSHKMYATDSVPQSKLATLVDLLQYRKQHQPTKTGYIFLEDGEIESDRLTYRDLDLQATAIAASLQAITQPGDRVLLLYPPGLEIIAAFFGCLYAGVIAVPSYSFRSNDNYRRIKSLIRDARATAILTTSSLIEDIQKIFTQNSQFNYLKAIATDKVALDLATAWQKPNINKHTLAFLQYNCGSTGPPKGTTITHQNLLHCGRLIQMGFGHTGKTIVVGWLPLFHGMGLVENLLQPLYLGIPSILMPPAAFLQKPICWLNAISRYKATTSGGPNFVYDLCVRKISLQQCLDLDLSSWEIAFNEAQSVRAKTIERFTQKFSPYGFRRQTFYPCYGKAETTLFICGGLKTTPPVFYKVNRDVLQQNIIEPAEDDCTHARTLVGCGQTFFEKIAIVDPQSKIRCPPNRVGEIWIAGTSVAQGYWNRDDLTQQVFQAYLANPKWSKEPVPYQGPFLRTGDLGFFHQGELFITGRLQKVNKCHPIMTKISNKIIKNLMENTVIKDNNSCNASGLIAIVGMSSLFPEAKTVGEFWENILSRKDCIREIVDGNPQEFDGFWRMDEYYDPNTLAIDKTYGKTGGFIPEIQFDPIEFGIPPIHLESISTIQLFALVLAKQALADAGYNRSSPTNTLKRERTGVVLGVGGCGNIAFTLGTRTNIPQWEKVMRNLGFPEEIVQVTLEKLKNLYAGWRESSFPGLLGNVVSGRISSYFDLGGTNCTLDAACASSLAALKMAIAELADGSCDAVLTGGVNVDNSILAYMCFSKTPALSKEGFSRPFDASSDGIVLGDGIGMLVLKRLEDAQADGNKIYGVIRGIGSSSDGRAKSIYAPRFEGQIQALNRAYQRAGVNPQEIQLVEAHGTGTIAGDLCEIKSISAVYQEHQVEAASVALGSIKSQIGHTRIAAGAASLIKVALGLYHKILPPTINVTQPHPQLDLDKSCFYLNTEARPWIQPADGSKRRAAVSSFGFGGTNFHVIVEEYQSEHESAYRLHQLPEVFIVQATNSEALRQTCQELLVKFKSAQGNHHYHHYCNSQRNTPIPQHSARLGFVSESLEQAIDYLEQALTLLSKHTQEVWQHPKGIYYRNTGLNPNSKIVALFPGQGTQSLNMGIDWAKNYPEVRQVLAQIDRIFSAQNRPPLSNIIYPPSVFNPEKLQQQKNELLKTENAQPAIGAISAGIYQVLKKAGFKPDFLVGHSFGELTALWASGVLSDRDFYQLSIARGQVMQVHHNSPTEVGLMLAVNANATQLQKFIAQFADVTITNYNSNAQTVLGGSKSSITTLQQQLNSEGIKTTLLSVANAFHTHFVKHAAQPLAEKILQTNFSQPSIPVYSNVTAQPYPQNTQEIQTILANHLLSPVAFKQTIEAIYSQGGRVFVEIGPKNVLTSFVNDILKDNDHIAIALNPPSQKSSEYELRRAIVQLLVAGVDLDGFDPYALPLPIEDVKSQPGLSITLNGGFYLNPDTKELRQKALVEKDTSVWDNFVQSCPSSPEPPSDSLPIDSLKTERSEISLAINGSHPSNHSSKNGGTSPIELNLEPKSHLSSSTRIEHFLNHQEIIMQQSLSNPEPLPCQDSSLLIANSDSISDRIESQNLISTVHQQFHHNQTKYLELLSKIIDHQSLLLEQYKELEVLPKVMQNLEKVLQLLQTNLGYVNANHQHYLQSQLSLLQSNGQPKADLTPPFIPENGVNDRLHPLEMSVVATDEVATAQTILLPTDLPSPQPTPSKPVSPLQLTVISSAATPVSLEKTVETVRESEVALVSPPSLEPTNLKSEVALVSPPRLETTHSIGNVDIEAISTSLLKIVSEKTGYPVEMLDLNMDLEADMGIDSIKQVEILGAMHDAYPEIELDADTLGETLGELRTLAQVVDYIKQVLSSDGSAIASTSLQIPEESPARSFTLDNVEAVLSSELRHQPEILRLTKTEPPMTSPLSVVITASSNSPVGKVTQVSPAEDNWVIPSSTSAAISNGHGLTSDNSIDLEAISTSLLKIVSEKTGYPVEMLDLNMDLEADMGIDSIKQVEILGAMHDAYPEIELDADTLGETLGELRTLAQVVDYIKQVLSSDRAATVESHSELNGITRQLVKKNT